MIKTFLLFSIFFIKLSVFSQSDSVRCVLRFEGTIAYDLAAAVEKNDTLEIKKIIEKDKRLLEVTNPASGANALALAVKLENYEAFKVLIDLGANPNFINALTKRSVLIDACKFYWKPNPYTIDLRFIELLLQKGADPNYAIEKNFVNEKGNRNFATSAIHKASKLDLGMVKLLIEYGADPYKKLEQYQNSPFYEALTGFGNKIEICNYFIDSLGVNIKEPLAVFEINDTKEVRVLYIQDAVVNNFLLAKVQDNSAALENLKSENPNIEKGNEESWEFIQTLKLLGVDFKNYQYKNL
jgi:hypothetical protein